MHGRDVKVEIYVGTYVCLGGTKLLGYIYVVIQSKQSYKALDIKPSGWQHEGAVSEMGIRHRHHSVEYNIRPVKVSRVPETSSSLARGG